MLADHVCALVRPLARSADDRRRTKEARLDNPSGWLYLTRHDAVPVLVDAVLDWPPDREFTVTEFARHAGLVRQTVSKHVGTLVDVGLVDPVPETQPQRYRVADGEVTRQLFELNSAINAAADA
jgi:DNA-binding transcriptional ArsR family regulator